MKIKNLKDLGEAYNSIYNQNQFDNWANLLAKEGYNLSEYTRIDLYEVYLNEAGNIPGRVVGGLTGALRDLPASTMSQLQGRGAVPANDAALRRQGQRGENLKTLLRTGKLPNSTPKPQKPQKPLVGKDGRNVFDGTQSRPTSRPIVRSSSAVSSTRPTSGSAGPVKPASASSSPKPSPSSNSSSANASRDEKIKGGMNVWKSQMKSGDVKGAAETGKNISTLKYGSDFAKPKGPNPLMNKTFGYQTGNAPDQQMSRASAIINSGKVAALKPQTTQTSQKPMSKSTGSKKPGNIVSGYEWASAKTLKDLSEAYASIYEAKKVDQDQDGDNDFADVRIARMIASGVPKEVAIQKVKNKMYNEQVTGDGSGPPMDSHANTKLTSPPPVKTTPVKKVKPSSTGVTGNGMGKPMGGPYNEEYEIYEIISSYLLENNFAETLNDANIIIENMSESWIDEILSEKYWIQGAIKRPGAFTKKAKEKGMSTSELSQDVEKHPGKYSTRTKKQASLASTLRSFK